MPEVKYVPNDSIAEQDVKIDIAPKTSIDIIPKTSKGINFYEQNGYVSIEAAHYTKAINTSRIKWKIIPGIGRDGDGITTFPVTEKIETITSSLPPNLEYEVYVYDTGAIKLYTYFSPTLNFHNDFLGLQYAISVDDEKPQIISINNEDKNTGSGMWEKWVSENIIIKTTNHKITTSGKHTVKYWMVNPGVVLQKLVLDFGGVKPSYLGPPETRNK